MFTLIPRRDSNVLRFFYVVVGLSSGSATNSAYDVNSEPRHVPVVVPPVNLDLFGLVLVHITVSRVILVDGPAPGTRVVSIAVDGRDGPPNLLFPCVPISVSVNLVSACSVSRRVWACSEITSPRFFIPVPACTLPFTYMCERTCPSWCLTMPSNGPLNRMCGCFQFQLLFLPVRPQSCMSPSNFILRCPTYPPVTIRLLSTCF